MAEKELVVLMNGTLLGHVRQASNGNLELTYDENYRNDPSATPLSTAMPLTGHLYRDRSVRPFLVGLLPDNDDVLARWGETLASLIGIPSRSLHTSVRTPRGRPNSCGPSGSTNSLRAKSTG